MSRTKIIRDAQGRKVGTISNGVGFFGFLLIFGAVVIAADAAVKYWYVTAAVVGLLLAGLVERRKRVLAQSRARQAALEQRKKLPDA